MDVVKYIIGIVSEKSELNQYRLCQKRRKINTGTLSQIVYVLSIYCQRASVTIDEVGNSLHLR